MNARRAETERRKRKRREGRERAWREWVCGGPLVDHARPVMTEDDPLGLEFARQVSERAARVEHEGRLLAIAFARGCFVRQRAAGEMLSQLGALLDRVRGPSVQATHTTNPAVTRTTGTTAIPRL